MGFIIWTVAAAIFLAIGMSARKESRAVGFFTFVEPPRVNDVKQYNKEVSLLWIAASLILEFIGIPILFSRQNSFVFCVIILAVLILLIAMMAVYLRIKAKYEK